MSDDYYEYKRRAIDVNRRLGVFSPAVCEKWDRELDEEEQRERELIEHAERKGSLLLLQAAVRIRWGGAGVRGRTGLEYKRQMAGPALRTRSDTVRIRTKADEPGTFQLYGLVFNVEDRQGDVIVPGAVANVEEFLSDGWIAWSHRNDCLPVGIPLAAEQDDHGFLVAARWHETQAARECRTVVKERQSAGKRVLCSIGYTVNDAAQAMRGGRPVRLLKSINVYECSIVLLPANPAAEVLNV